MARTDQQGKNSCVSSVGDSSQGLSLCCGGFVWDGAGRESLNSLMATGCTACTAGAAGSRGQGPGLALPATTDTERWAVNKSPCCCWRAFTASLHSSAPFERADQRLRQRQGFIFNAFCAQEQLPRRAGFGAASFPLGPLQFQFQAVPSAPGCASQASLVLSHKAHAAEAALLQLNFPSFFETVLCKHAF